MIRRLLVLLLLSVPAYAEDPKLLASNYDTPSTSYTFCLYSDERERPSGAVIDVVSASTSITSGSTGAFTGMGVGDILYFNAQGTTTSRRITTWTNANSIVVNASTTLAAGTVFRWRKLACGTAATDGWFDVARHPGGQLYIAIATLNATSLEIQVQCKDSFGAIGEVFTESFTAVTSPNQMRPILELGEGCPNLRVGSKVTSDGGAQDLSLSFAPGLH